MISNDILRSLRYTLKTNNSGLVRIFALADAPVIDRWAGIRPRAKSRAPMVGPWPGRPGHYVANGGFKIGLAMAPAVAVMLADLILDGTDRIPPGFLPPVAMAGG